MANREKDKRKKRVVSAKKMAETSANRVSKAFKLPDGVSAFFLKKAGLYKLDIIPFAAGKGNPAADPGEMVPGRTYQVHTRVGPNNDTYCCLAQNFGKPCPICEYRAKLDRDPSADEDLVKALRPRQRQLWNVYDQSNPDRGVQVWDFSSFNFGEHLFAKLDRYPEHVTFADPDEGKTLHIGANEEDGGGFKFFDCADIEFRERKPLSQEIVDAAVCLDDILVEPTYDQLKHAYFQDPVDVDKEADEPKDEDEDEPAEPPRKRKPAAVDPEEEKEDEDDDNATAEPVEVKAAPAKVKSVADYGFELEDIVYHPEHGKCEIIKIAKDGMTMVLEVAADEEGEGDIHANIKPAEISRKKPAEPDRNGAVEEDDDEPAAPKAKTKATKEVPFDEDEEEDEPAPRKKRNK